MSKKLYLKQQLPILILHFVCMALLSLFLLANGNNIDTLLFVLLVWCLVLAAYLFLAYASRNARLKKLLNMTEQLQERYLISEIMDKPARADDYVYYRILKMANKSMLEKIGAIERERMEYKEYIEQWVHEIKTPITAIKLLCENHRSPLTKNILTELEKTNRFTEQALYYARSEQAQKDYCVREIRLFDVVHQAIAENKYLLLQYDVSLDLKETEDNVFSDEKWLCFILNQFIVNAVKYRSAHPVLSFYAERCGGEILLCVKDNGIGIDESDLPRIFEKGFTGKNGRTASQNATGIGLYLCKRLCDKLGIGIAASSSKAGTTLQLSFHINDFIQEVQG